MAARTWFAEVSLTAAALCLAVGCGGSGGGPVQVSVTGEDLARDGLVFTPAPAPGQPVFVDGWSVRFTRWITVIDNVRLSQPGSDPAQQRLVGATVAQRSGPFAVDLVRAGQADADSGVALLTIDKGDDGAALDTQVRYAFSFDGVPATAATQGVNLDADGQGLLADMAAAGDSNAVIGVATHPAGGSAPFDSYPTTVNFTFRWGGQVNYLNCQNPDNGNDEVQNRGVQPRQDGTQRAAITFHTEHLFWDTLNIENPTIRFDPIAAQAAGPRDGAAVTLDGLKDDRVLDLKDAQGQPIPDRGSLPGYTPRSGSLIYDVNGTTSVKSLREFIIYSAQAQAHLNGDGLCFVNRL